MSGSRAIRLLDETMDLPIARSIFCNLVKAPDFVRALNANELSQAAKLPFKPMTNIPSRGPALRRRFQGPYEDERPEPESDWLGRFEVDGIGCGRGYLPSPRIVLNNVVGNMFQINI